MRAAVAVRLFDILRVRASCCSLTLATVGASERQHLHAVRETAIGFNPYLRGEKWGSLWTFMAHRRCWMPPAITDHCAPSSAARLRSGTLIPSLAHCRGSRRSLPCGERPLFAAALQR
jgi:hypothetical protein